MEWNIQWIKYLLGQSYIEEDFKLDNSNFGENAEKKANAQRLLSRFLSPSNFRAVINATSVNIVKPGAPATGAGQTGATTTTAPSTPIMHPSDTYAFKNKIENKSPEYLGQHSYFKRDPDTGLPTAGLAEEVSKIHLDGLTKKQNDILTLACKLAFTVVFSLQELEVCIHSGLRFLFFLRLVEMAKGMDEKAKTYAVISYHRWLIRSAYRDEQTGRVLRVDGENELLPNLKALIGFLGTASSTVVDPRVIYGIHHDLGWFYFGKFNWSEAYNHLLQYKALSKGIPDENLARLPSRFGTADDLIAVCMEMNKSQTPMDDDKPGQIMIKYSEKPEKLFSPEKLLTSIISRNPNPDCMVVDPNRQLQLKNRVEINTLIMKKQLFKATKLTIINSLESCFKEGRLNGFWCHEVDQSCISYVHRKKVSNPASHASDSEIDQLLETVDIWITNTIEKAGRYQEDKVRMCADTVTTYIFGYLFSEIFTSRRPDHYKKVKDCIVKCVKRDHSLSPGKAIGQLNDDYGALLQDYLRGIKYLELEDYIKALECFEFNKGHYDIVKYQNPDTEATYQSLTTQMRVYGLLTKVLIVGGNSNAAKVFIDEMKTIDSAVKNIEYLHMVSMLH
ncbi:hypothetical protein H4219_003204 [Mycoemilia scoparia]|uniref:Uncharacterized protein n=1 Tax=Mycoemilia scoparia TaxID=417184 RepID=A0A9W7ZVJ5_9FUNG|nr:hypothetical protein H4219_003204 [Mycoemilia scoparia]